MKSLILLTLLLITLFALPTYAQFTSTRLTPAPCSDALKKSGNAAINALKQGGPVVKGKRYPLTKAFSDLKVSCSSDGDLILSVKTKGDPQLLVDLMKAKVEPALKGKGISRVVVQAYRWDRYERDNPSYRVTPVWIITTRTGSSTVSTVTGGQVVKSGQYGYKQESATAMIDY